MDRDEELEYIVQSLNPRFLLLIIMMLLHLKICASRQLTTPVPHDATPRIYQDHVQQQAHRDPAGGLELISEFESDVSLLRTITAECAPL